MQKLVLKNGLTVFFKKKEGTTVSVQVLVKVGSNDEKKGEKGIAHVVEHLVFEGTKKRANAQIISGEIESVGGEFNAYTTNWRTSYYIKVLNKHFVRSMDLMSDIMQNSVIRKEDLDRERKIILKEIDMFNDDPKSYQWLKLEKILFKKNNCRFPSYGDKGDLKKLNREDIFNFYKKHYVASNMVLAIVGDVKNWKKLVREKWGSFEKGRKKVRPKVYEPVLKKNSSKKEKKDFANSYILLGYTGSHRGNKDCYVLDVISAILGKGQSGKLFHEIRGKRGLAYDIGVENSGDVDFGYFVVFASVDKKNVLRVKKLILEEIAKLQYISSKDLKDAKTYLEGDYLMALEDTQKQSDLLLYWNDVAQVKGASEYIKKIKKVSLADVRSVAKKYFAKHAIVVLEGKK